MVRTVSGYPNIVPTAETEYLVETPGGITANVSQATLDNRFAPAAHATDQTNPHQVTAMQAGAAPEQHAHEEYLSDEDLTNLSLDGGYF